MAHFHYKNTTGNLYRFSPAVCAGFSFSRPEFYITLNGWVKAMEKNENYAFSGLDAGDGRLRHSGAGIASFVLALASAAMLLTFFLAAGIQAFRIAEQYIDPNSGIPTISQEELSRELLNALNGTVLLLPLALLATMIAIVTGIVALAAKNRRKGFGIAGLVISGMQVLFFLFGIMLNFAAA